MRSSGFNDGELLINKPKFAVVFPNHTSELPLWPLQWFLYLCTLCLLNMLVRFCFFARAAFLTANLLLLVKVLEQNYFFKNIFNI